ncbi:MULTISPECIES: tripartite tricarboxylate transporter substrate binding protein [unclassified Bradyrhizobium]|uniref:Bug family tripartite tricarboxylate transporter substrate binding protein n=1 Tax=unclassified Bradyrhizobium TaxID=2631580 RepID=UPI001BAB7D87|nr:MULTISPECIES: tripartite tricarboxylate transporter substrate binding protein [unclassified Bradyrhizobium]MBR1226865.1 tripartite tricarboxylate transporter substrate binding protein [Bradyrhizobium sp. AUGA SZCCT0176]MBR1234254.1 tripartite tricarboxylate transporter substrate binding protein [Bradyrhizobium sp. AUGA SZCCT0182]MBR1296772.1 tripartite tricarboxylate transporter substrate binding protein [Bradyrhizobium sp. AUGA SZCCT0042]
MHGFTALAPNGRHLAVLPLLLALSAHVHAPALAGDYPDRTVKIVVPFPAGGTADAVPRIVGEWLSRKWGQPVVIENRTGAAGNIGSETAYRSAPDGYTLLSSPPPPLVINQSLYPKLGFDPTRFEPVIVMAQVPNALIVNPDKVKASSVTELIEYLRNNPDKLTCATQGNGTTSHLTSELFQLMTRVKLRHIPYRGSAPALQGLLAGDVDVMFDNLGVSLPLVQAGKLKLLAVASPARLPALPDVPTIAETLPGFEAVAWYGIVAPPDTPKNITDKINADVNEVLRQPEVQEQLRKLSADIFGGSVDKTSKYMREEVDRWAAVIKSANIQLQ